MAFTLSLRDDVTLTERGPGELQLQVPGRPAVLIAFRQVSPVIGEVFARLQREGIGEDTVTETVLEHDGTQGLFKLTHFLKRLEDARLLCRSVIVGGSMMARLVPLSDRWVMAPAAAPTERRSLSRFALMRRLGDRMIVESPLGHARIELSAAGAAAVAGLAAGDAADLSARMQWPDQAAADLLWLLASAGALTGVDDDGHTVEDRHPALMQWEFHDLYFHSRSRIGRHANPFGATFAFDERVPALPAIKPAVGTSRVELVKPDIDRLMTLDPPFARVVEERRSVRDQGESPIELSQLSEFLFRSARVKSVWSTDHGEVSQRIYPAGGALYETEVYAVVDRVAGLEAGLYHYDPSTHALERIAERTPAVAALLDQAYYTADQRSRPQVLLVLTARFQRMQWKYQSMVYAAVLKHVGVLYQQMYLAATAMGLAPCALGGGHSDLFADAAGLDYYAETSVGEFILGTRADAGRAGSRFEDRR